MYLTGSIDITLQEGPHNARDIINAIRRTRMELDRLVQVDISEPARSRRTHTIIIGTRTEWTTKETTAAKT